VPAGRTVDGQDIRPFLEGRAPSPADWFFYYDSGGRLEGVRDRRWKLHLTFPEKGEPATELFDLLADPSERWNVAAEQPDVVARLRTRMQAFAAEVAAAR
jgi:arylsulfatase A-like enzyme